MNYKIHAENDSMYNTPATFGIYIAGLVFKWLLNMADLMRCTNVTLQKQKYYMMQLIRAIYYKGTVVPEDRSIMNVTYRLPSEALEEKFIKEASAKGFSGLKGHRSVGGIRASIYNAFPQKGIEELVSFMSDFKKNN